MELVFVYLYYTLQRQQSKKVSLIISDRFNQFGSVRMGSMVSSRQIWMQLWRGFGQHGLFSKCKYSMLGITTNGKGSYDVVHVIYVHHISCIRNCFIFRIIPNRFESVRIFPNRSEMIWNLFKVGGEFFYVVTRVTVKANKRRTERKRAKLALTNKPAQPLLEEPTEESIVKPVDEAV